VWSLGVILYMLVVGQAPFQEANDSETLTMIMDCKYSVPGYVSATCQSLIGRMLVREPASRATLDDIAKHDWLGGDTEVCIPALFIYLFIKRDKMADFTVKRLLRRFDYKLCSDDV